MELYGTADSLNEAKHLVEAYRALFAGVIDSAYAGYRQEEVVGHGLRLACGLESQLKGESQILDQLEAWTNRADFPAVLKDTWDFIITSAAEIRAASGLNKENISVVALLFEDLNRRAAFAKGPDVTVIGTGKIAELIAMNVRYPIKTSFVARKRRSKAERLARRTGGEALLPDEIHGRLLETDVVISATSSPHCALKGSHFRKTHNARRKPLYIYDMAVPHDVSPEVREIPGVKVLDLNCLISNSKIKSTSLAGCLKAASGLVDEKVSKYTARIKDEKDKDRYEAEPFGFKTGRRDSGTFAGSAF
jgi:glutamyl-tRNA reductase